MDLYGIPPARLADVCGVDLSTARRWKRRGRAPGRYARLLELAGGELGALSIAWRGWRLVEGDLVNPEGERFAVGQVRALRLNQQLVAELERQLRRVHEAAGRVLEPRELTIRIRVDGDHAHVALAE